MIPATPLSTDHTNVVSISLAHLDRLLAIQSAAREFRRQWEHHAAYGGKNVVAVEATMLRLFALLDAAPVGGQ